MYGSGSTGRWTGKGSSRFTHCGPDKWASVLIASEPNVWLLAVWSVELDVMCVYDLRRERCLRCVVGEES